MFDDVIAWYDSSMHAQAVAIDIIHGTSVYYIYAVAQYLVPSREYTDD